MPDRRRLRALTGAVIAVASGLELRDVLQQLVSTAATFSGARYAALGISGPEGRIVQFITHGISPELREKLGGMPSAHGVPGMLLHPEARTVRLERVDQHPRSVGFPPDHPPMHSFLGVPVRVHGRIFGNLYVAEKATAAPGPALFTADDEEALLALGAAAGVAVENARLYAAVQRKQRWSRALSRANHAIIARSDRDARARLAPVPGIAREAGECALAVLAFRQADGTWRVHSVDGEAGSGADAADAVGRALPEALAAQAVPDAVSLLTTEDLGWLPGSWARGLLVPVSGARGTCEEALVLAYREHPDSALGPADLSGELEFGQRLGLALQVAQAQSDSTALRLLRDRDRIARDLHDLVIQRLFAIGLSLQAAGVVARVPEVQARLGRAVDDIDETIKDVRRTIFELHAEAPRSSLRDRLDDVLADLTDSLPRQLDVQVGAGVDEVPPELGADLIAALREVLTNVARHALATAVQVYVTVGREIELEVVDDGVGLPAAPHSGNGLANLAERAAAHGGVFEVSAAPGGGTVVRWAVPLP